MKKTIKILSIALCAIIALTPVMLAGNFDFSIVQPNTTNTGAEKLGNRVIGIIQVVGIFISIGTLMVIGIKYMMGSAEEKAEYKKVVVPYLIGAILVFGASLLAPKLYEVAQTLF